MEAGEDAQLHGLGSVLAAPHVCCRDPEHLLLGVVEAGQQTLGAVALHPRSVGVIGLLDTAVVGNVLTLCVDSVQLK